MATFKHFPKGSTIGTGAYKFRHYGVESVDELVYFIEGDFVEYENDLVEAVGSYAFDSHTTLTGVSFPNATSIGNCAFEDCSALTDISFPNVTNIGTSAFEDCSALTDISFPKVTSIGTNAFRNCSALTTVTLMENQVCQINATTFPSTVTQFRVPTALVEAYKADTTWATFANKIVGV